MIFSKDQAAQILAGKQSATLLPPGRNIRPGTVRALRRRVMRHDQDGNELGWETSTVEQGDGEDRLPVKITIVSADVIQLDAITVQRAQWCGHRTISGCRTAFEAAHPQHGCALLVRFALGDLRDRDRYLARGTGYTHSPHLALMPDAPAVPADVQRRLTIEAHKRDATRITDPDIRLRLSLAHAIEEWQLETGGRASSKDAFARIKMIREQIRALDRHIRAA